MGACGFGADCPFARGVCGWGPPDEDSIRAEAREEALFEAREEARDKLERVREELERVRKERDEAVAENECGCGVKCPVVVMRMIEIQ